MSGPPSAATAAVQARQGPHPWLAFVWPVAVVAAGALLSYGAQSADYRHLDRRTATLEADVALLKSEQGEQGKGQVRASTELEAIRRELERLTRAVERLAEDRGSTARR